MHLRADGQFLRMSTHAPPRHEYDERGDEIASRPPTSIARQPYSDQPGCPPYNPHGRVLQIVVRPRRAPAVFGEGVNHPPRSNDARIPELLRAARAGKPGLAAEEDDSEEDAVGHERRAHDEMGQTLAQMVALAETLRRNTTEEHLRPGDHGEEGAAYQMGAHEEGTDAAQQSAGKVEFEVGADQHLDEPDEHDEVGKFRMGVGAKLAALVEVAEEVGHDGEEGGEDLDGNVQARAHEAEHEAGREEQAPGKGLEEDVRPEYGIDGFGGYGLAIFNLRVVAVGRRGCGVEGEEEGEESGREESGWSGTEGGHIQWRAGMDAAEWWRKGVVLARMS